MIDILKNWLWVQFGRTFRAFGLDVSITSKQVSGQYVLHNFITPSHLRDNTFQRFLTENKALAAVSTKEGVRVERLSRVVREVELHEDHITGKVHHPTLQRRDTRRMSTHHTFQAVYYWVGSLSTQPEFFQRLEPSNNDQKLSDGVYHIVGVKAKGPISKT